MKYLFIITLFLSLVGCGTKTQMMPDTQVKNKKVKNVEANSTLGTNLIKQPPELHKPSSKKLIQNAVNTKRLQ